MCDGACSAHTALQNVAAQLWILHMETVDVFFKDLEKYGWFSLQAVLKQVIPIVFYIQNMMVLEILK